jgi:hypothetical protein
MKKLKISDIITLAVIVVCLGWILLGVSQRTTKNAHVSTAPTQYIDTQAGFKITVPADWRKDATQAGYLADFKNVRSVIIPGSESYSPYISIINAPNQFPSLNALVGADISDISQQTGNFKSISSTPETISQQPATLLVYSFKLQGTLSLTNAQLIVVKGATEYGVTGTSLTSSWAHYSGAIEKALLSLQI